MPAPAEVAQRRDAIHSETSEAAKTAPSSANWWSDHPVAPEDERWVPGHGLEFESRDGLFALAIRLRAQFLYQVEREYDPEGSAHADPRHNLTLRRARVVFAQLQAAF
jgi:hypothetical protein